MKYVDEYRQPHLVRNLSEALHKITTKPWTIMEVCGGQTHSIMKYGLHELLPKKIRLIHGPGCPVCVTPIHLIDHALHIAAEPNTILCSFGDMLRVPGTHTDLLTMKARGSDVRIIHSPLETVKIAEKNPNKQVVLFAVGFETTAPANAMAVYQAKQLGLKNFSLLASHVLVPPALQFILQSPGNEVQGFLAAGHVCTITGYSQYHALASNYQTPIVVTGFEPVDILQGLYLCVQQLENNEYCVMNQYARSVKEPGNVHTQNILQIVFKTVDRQWRGIGVIASSGLGLQDEYAGYDAATRFPIEKPLLFIDNGCISGLVLQGKKKPGECPLFGKQCTPENPLGAPMVSTEGACSAYYQYSKLKLA
ncbi:MAG: hydrogenase formation protein HypD [Chlamydiae bacterium]|nr:hydrogenase formation protein HypD [Chlamydiota bacterium]